ncbi:MAG: pyridoxamine 5'-phosphate oxidase family protein [Candidatus Omnitrophota bacterium]|nr:MAG: pyridoxamine 5'-phosphate oxidase family protein [Candidatus Omnitrophota bacterium]
MKELSPEIIDFLKKQGFVIVSTLDEAGSIHCSTKGIVGIEKEGKIHLVDLYKENTFNNLGRNPTISITAVDDDKFIGFTLKGEAKIVERENLEVHIIIEWENRVIERISKRVIKDITKGQKPLIPPESLFPQPQYLIEMDVEDIVDLAPADLKTET